MMKLPFRPALPANPQPGGWSLAGLLAGCTLGLPVFIIAVPLAFSLDYPFFLAATLTGALMAAVVAYGLLLAAQRSGGGMPQLVQNALGPQGGRAAMAAILGALLAVFALALAFFTQLFLDIALEALQITPPYFVVLVAGGILIGASALMGLRITRAGPAAAGLFALLLLPTAFTFLVDGKLARIFEYDAPPPALPMGIGASIVMAACFFALIAADGVRLLTTRRAMTIATFTSYGAFYPALFAMAGTLGIVAVQRETGNLLVAHSFVLPAVAAVLLAAWTGGCIAIRSAALAMQALMPQLNYGQAVTGFVMAGIILAGTGAALGFTANIFGWLMIIGNLLAPLACICALTGAQRHAGTAGHPLPTIIWLASFWLALFTTPTELFGYGAFTLSGAPALDAMLAATLGCVLLRLWTPRKSA